MPWKYVKWTGLLLLLSVAAAAAFTKKTFQVEVTIAAASEKVWAVLVDTKRYGEWNPVFVNVDGAYAQGKAVTNTVRFPNGSDVKMTANVETLKPQTELRQTGGFPGFLTYDHRWLLEPVAGGTRVVQHEVDRGIWLWFWDSSWIEPAYSEVLKALAKQVAKQETNMDQQ